MRSGNEPSTARSPLRLRLVLALFGLGSSVLAVALLSGRASLGIVLMFAVVGLVAAVDVAVVLRRLRQGPHFQPGPQVPPYRPAGPEPVRAPRPEIDEDTRIRRYLTIMGTCLLLITTAWTLVQQFSLAAAVVMSVVAAVLPPVAVIVANFGVRLPAEATEPPEGPPRVVPGTGD